MSNDAQWKPTEEELIKLAILTAQHKPDENELEKLAEQLRPVNPLPKG